jgi:serine/threonine-protein kinase
MPERFLGRSLGKFRVDGLVGSGGFAWVYKAYDPDLDVPVALKVLKPQFAGDGEFEQRFRREAATAARLRHPNIIKIFAVGKDGEAVYFAMDFLPQGLPDRLDLLTTLPDPVLIRIGIDVASALGFAHREGVVHRDIKVDNILFDEHGNAVVADFGIARAVSNYVQETGTNMVVGTPQYFSPEQARGLPLDGRADIYSLGVTLYRAATGTLPFNGDDWYDVARQHVEERPVRPRVHNKQLSRDLERVILRCLEKDPTDRYQTGELLCQALASLSVERNDSVAMRGTPALLASDTPTATIPMQVNPRLTRPWRSFHPGRRWAGRWAGRWASRGARLGAILAVSLAALIAIPAVRLRLGHWPPVAALLRGSSAAVSSSGGANPATAGPSSPANAPAGRPSAAGVYQPAPLPGGNGASGTAKGAGPAPLATSGGQGTAATPAALPARPKQDGLSTVGANTTVIPTAGPPDRGYGTLRLEATPAGALYTLQGLDNGHVSKGHTPLSGTLTLPAGPYSVVISARYCATYRDTLRIVPNRAATPLRVRLVCGS